MRRRLLISVLVLLLLSVVVAAPRVAAEPAGPLPDRVDRFVADYLGRHGLPGAAVAVTKDGELVHAAGYGHDSAGRPLTEDSRLRIASVSKSITAFAVLQLVDDGLVDLDRPVADYVHDFVLDDQRAAAVTVRQLLSCSSGYSGRSGWTGFRTG